MKIEKQDVALALQFAEAKNQELNVSFDQAAMDSYKAMLQGIAL